MKRHIRSIVLALLCMLALPAFAADITPNSPCGALATGYRHDDRKTVVTYQADGQYVNADGVWDNCPPAPPKPPEPKPCPAAPAWKTWAVGGSTCTAQLAGTAEAAGLDRTLAHGEEREWRQWLGAMRGQVTERCTDGVRSVVSVSCAPATHCDTMISDIQREGRKYAYDGRPVEKRVALGKSVDALADDGSRWPITCVAGDWYVPADRPTLPKPTPTPVKRVLWCGPQTIRSKLAPNLVLTYRGQRVLPGAEVDAISSAGDAVKVVCGAGAVFVPKWDLK